MEYFTKQLEIIRREYQMLEDREEKYNIQVIYLTLDGHEPSSDSLADFQNFENLQNLSYVELILPWLEY